MYSLSDMFGRTQNPHAANQNVHDASNWAFTPDERRLLRHAVKDHEGWTYVDAPSKGKVDVRYFCHKNDVQTPIFCVQKIGSVSGNPTYVFRKPWNDGEKTAHFPDLLMSINTILKKTMPPVVRDISLVHNG